MVAVPCALFVWLLRVARKRTLAASEKHHHPDQLP